MPTKRKKYAGEDIREVWDFRLSKAAPYLFNSGEFWVIRIMANDAPDGEPNCLEEIVTDIPTAETSTIEGQARCYPILREIRDKYSRDNVDARKPVVALINAANKTANELTTAMSEAEAAGDFAEAWKRQAELKAHLSTANAEIKAASEMLHNEIGGNA